MSFPNFGFIFFYFDANKPTGYASKYVWCASLCKSYDTPCAIVIWYLYLSWLDSGTSSTDNIYISDDRLSDLRFFYIYNHMFFTKWVCLLLHALWCCCIHAHCVRCTWSCTRSPLQITLGDCQAILPFAPRNLSSCYLQDHVHARLQALIFLAYQFVTHIASPVPCQLYIIVSWSICFYDKVWLCICSLHLFSRQTDLIHFAFVARLVCFSIATIPW